MTAPDIEVLTEGDLLDRADAVELLERQAEVLGMVAEGNDLSLILTTIVAALEHLITGARCSILLFHASTNTLHHGAAPSLPQKYTDAINGMSIGPSAGSCGTAAFTGSPVIAEDIARDDRWENFRLLALPHGLRSCWSTPIRGRSGISGTFAVYHDAPHSPTPREQLLVDRFTHLASVAIDHAHLFGALVQSEESFRHAFEHNAIGMALVGLDSRLVRVNRALREMLRRPEAELLGTTLDQLIQSDALAPDGSSLLADLVTGKHDRLHFSARARTSTGREVRLAVSSSVIRDANGTPAVVGVNLLDVTHRRAADAERRARREAEVARKVAESASHNKSDFLAAMSHDIRTPLQSITGFTEMLRSMPLTTEQRQTALEHIATATEHITALVDDVLDIARIEAGSLPLRLAEVPLDQAIREVLSIVGPLAQARSVSLGATRSTVNVRADERRLRQVLLNLVTNAVVYNHPGGTVSVDTDTDTDTDTDEVAISITNTGSGIPADKLDRLFVPFDRLGAEDSGEPGIGLGLTLALGLTEAMGGSLTVDSSVGEDTTVTVILQRVT